MINIYKISAVKNNINDNQYVKSNIKYNKLIQLSKEYSLRSKLISNIDDVIRNNANINNFINEKINNFEIKKVNKYKYKNIYDKEFNIQYQLFRQSTFKTYIY